MTQFKFVAIDCSGAIMIRSACKQDRPGQMWEAVKAKWPDARPAIDQRNFDGDAVSAQFSLIKPIMGRGDLPLHGERFTLEID